MHDLSARIKEQNIPETPPSALSKRQEKLRRKQQLNPSTPKTNLSPFREVERKYKKAASPEDYDDVLDLSSVSSRSRHSVEEVELTENPPTELFGSASERGFEDGRQPAYTLSRIPGLILLPGALSPSAQQKLVKVCIKEYVREPNLTNLHTHYEMPQEGLWKLVEDELRGTRSADSQRSGEPETWVKPKLRTARSIEDNDDYDQSEDPSLTPPSAINKTEDPSAEPVATKRILSSATGPSQEEQFAIDKAPPSPSSTVPFLAPSALIRRLRWVTLGYQYHWASKTYHFDKRYPFPALVADMSRSIARAVEGLAGNTYPGAEFKPEAGVVNFYQLKDTLMAHVDRSELNTRAPLVSFSLGNACVFVIGADTRDVEPLPVLLRSGDVLVMTGPSRGAFHGVPKIIEGTLPDHLKWNASPPDSNPGEWEPMGRYMEQTRINVNVRQVFSTP